jgi:hypothetical protein
VLVALLALLSAAPPSSDAVLYDEMRADTLRKGRALELVLRQMVPLTRRTDECVLIAAPDDQDWEGEYKRPDGARTNLKVGFDRQGNIVFLSLRFRPKLPDDPHEHDPPVKLTLPVLDRPLVAFAGGPTRMWNQHVLNPDQRHAIDLVSWKDGGSYGNKDGDAERTNEDFNIFDAEVRAPIDGTVVYVDTGAEDHEHPQREWQDDEHPFGNCVVIRIDHALLPPALSAPSTPPPSTQQEAVAPPPSSDDRYVVLGHMKKGSVVVAVDQEVKTGQLIGHVGNSGNSSEPHLHMHVQDGPALKQGLSVPFLVDGHPVRRGVFMEAKRRNKPGPPPVRPPADIPITLTTDPRE